MKKAKKNNNKTVGDSISDDSEVSEAGSNYSTASEGGKSDKVFNGEVEEDFVDAQTDDTREACSSNTDTDGLSQGIADKSGKSGTGKFSGTGSLKPKVSQNPSRQNNNQQIPNLLLETSL